MSQTPLKILFAGTPDFSVAPLEALLSSDHEVIGVYTQPDRPAGRGRKLKPGPVKQVALDAGIPVYQPENFRDEADLQQLEVLQPDLMVVVAYGLLLPQRVLDVPRFGCINIHASLLPRWRGAAPIQRAILAGDRETGITIMQMEAGLDTGPMMHVEKLAIGERETGGQLHDRLAPLGATALMKTLDKIQKGTVELKVQDDSLACYARKLEKQEARIDWNLPADEIDRLVRAFNPWPVAFTGLDGKNFRLWETLPLQQAAEKPPGEVEHVHADAFDVATATQLLRVTRVQLQGKRAMSVKDFLNAHNMDGVSLG